MKISHKNRLVRSLSHYELSLSKKRIVKRKIYKALLKKIKEELSLYGYSYILIEQRNEFPGFTGHSQRHGLEESTVSSWTYTILRFSRIGKTGIIRVEDGYYYYSRPLTLGWSFMSKDLPKPISPELKIVPLKGTVDTLEKAVNWKHGYSSKQVMMIIVGTSDVQKQIREYANRFGGEHYFWLRETTPA